VVIPDGDVLGVFDMDSATASRLTQEFLARAEKAGEVENVGQDLPKSFVVCAGRGSRRVYLSQLAPATLKNRSEII
jgi:hypothetical protein